jgi:hypothetical protein
VHCIEGVKYNAISWPGNNETDLISGEVLMVR